MRRLEVIVPGNLNFSCEDIPLDWIPTAREWCFCEIRSWESRDGRTQRWTLELVGFRSHAGVLGLFAGRLSLFFSKLTHIVKVPESCPRAFLLFPTSCEYVSDAAYVVLTR